MIADLEAGIGTLTRLDPGSVDVGLVVVEPTAKSIEVGRRALAVLHDKAVPVYAVVANRIATCDEAADIHAAFPAATLFRIPDDPAVAAADRAGLAPLDTAPDAPSMRALAAVADWLDGRLAAATRPPPGSGSCPATAGPA